MKFCYLTGQFYSPGSEKKSFERVNQLQKSSAGLTMIISYLFSTSPLTENSVWNCRWHLLQAGAEHTLIWPVWRGAGKQKSFSQSFFHWATTSFISLVSGLCKLQHFTHKSPMIPGLEILCTPCPAFALLQARGHWCSNQRKIYRSKIYIPRTYFKKTSHLGVALHF